MKALFAAALLGSTLTAQTPALAAESGPASRHPQSGSLREAARRDGARLAAASGTRSAQQTSPRQRNWVSRHPVLVGTLAGTGVGLGMAAGSGCESSSDYTCGGIALFFAGTGAGLGAVGGLIVSAFQR